MAIAGADWLGYIRYRNVGLTRAILGLQALVQWKKMEKERQFSHNSFYAPLSQEIILWATVNK